MMDAKKAEIYADLRTTPVQNEQHFYIRKGRVVRDNMVVDRYSDSDW